MKLSKFISIVILTAAVTTLLGGFLVVQATDTGAQELAEEVYVPEPVLEIDAGEVPDAGSFGDLLMGLQERAQLWLANSDDKRLALEETFAARREAQLEKLEALPDDHPRKAELIEKLNERHEAILERWEVKAAKVSDRQEKALDKIDELRARFEAKKEIVESRKEDREEKRTEMMDILKQKRDEVRSERGELRGELEQKREEVREDAQEAKADYMETKTMVRKNIIDRAKELEDKKTAREAEVKQAEQLMQQDAAEESEIQARKMIQKRVTDDGALLSPAEAGRVQGAIDYEPQGIFERLGYYFL